MKLRNLIIAVAGVALTAGVGGAASAATPWQLHHPRRVEVNHRLNHLNREIRYERRHGEMSAAEAGRLHHRLHMIRHQERFLASRQGGHITRYQQGRLNGEENAVKARVG